MSRYGEGIFAAILVAVVASTGTPTPSRRRVLDHLRREHVHIEGDIVRFDDRCSEVPEDDGVLVRSPTPAEHVMDLLQELLA